MKVGIGSAQMAHSGYQVGWGLGRQMLVSRHFHYVSDPWGAYAEYSLDIESVPHTLDWLRSEADPENSLFLWGPMPPGVFGTNHKAAAA